MSNSGPEKRPDGLLKTEGRFTLEAGGGCSECDCTGFVESWIKRWGGTPCVCGHGYSTHR